MALSNFVSRNRQLVIDDTNQWPKGREVGPFFTFPAWWRRFIFQVLNSREVTVYLYLCSVMDENAVAFPTIDQIAEDLGITKAPVRQAIATLGKRGFLLVKPDVRRKITVYQRPAISYTLLVLLEGGVNADPPNSERPVVDGTLTPFSDPRTPKRLALIKNSDSVVNSGLVKLLSKGAYTMYQLAKAKVEADEILREILITDLKAQAKTRIAAQPPSIPDLSLDMSELTPEQIEMLKRFFPDEHKAATENAVTNNPYRGEIEDEIPF